MGMGVDIHINVMPTTGTQPPTQQRSESQARMDQARRLMDGVITVLNQLEVYYDAFYVLTLMYVLLILRHLGIGCEWNCTYNSTSSNLVA